MTAEQKSRRNKQRRDRLATDPEYRERINKTQRERARRRYAENAEFRELQKQRTKAWQAKHPDYWRGPTHQRHASMKDDPKLMERERRRMRKKYNRLKADPKKLAALYKRNAEYKRRKRVEAKRNGSK